MKNEIFLYPKVMKSKSIKMQFGQKYVYNQSAFPSKERLVELMEELSNFKSCIVRVYNAATSDLIHRGNIWVYLLEEWKTGNISYNFVTKIARGSNGKDIGDIVRLEIDMSIDENLVNLNEYFALHIISHRLYEYDDVLCHFEDPETLLVLSGLECCAKLLMVPLPPQKVESMFGIKDGMMTTVDNENIDNYVDRYNDGDKSSINHVLNVRYQNDNPFEW